MPAANSSTISPGGGGARVDELAHASRDRLRLALAPVRAGIAVAALVADEQLDRMAEDRVGELARRGERLVVLAELLAEQMVDRGEHLRPRAVVEGQRQVQRRALAPLAEHRDVGVAEAVDRLELVADEEHIRRARAGAEQVDDVALQTVRVLELVDHQRAEPQLLRLAHLVVVAEQVAREQLQVLEVERRLTLLRRGVLGGEEVEQLLQEILVALGELVERCLLEPVARVAERRGPVTGRREHVREVEQLRRVRAERERGIRGRRAASPSRRGRRRGRVPPPAARRAGRRRVPAARARA